MTYHKSLTFFVGLILGLSLSQTSFAKDKKVFITTEFENVSKDLKRHTLQTAVKYLSLKKGYSISIYSSGSMPPKNVDSELLIIKIKKEKEFNISLQRIENTNRDVINKVSKAKVPELTYIRNLELLLRKLWSDSEKEKAKKEDKKESIEDKENDSPFPELPSQNSKIIDQYNKFKRIRAAKANQVISKQIEQAQKINEAEKAKVQAELAQLAMSNNYKTNAVERFPHLKKKFEAGLTYYNKNNVSKDIIDVNTNFTYLGAKGFFQMDLNKSSGDAMYTVFELGKVVESEGYNVPNYYSLGIRYMTPLFDYLLGAVEIEMDNQVIINLPELNEGLQVAETNVFWFNFSLSKDFIILEREIFVYALVGKTFFNQIQYENSGESFPLEGNKLEVGIDSSVYENISFGLQYELVMMNAAGGKQLTITQNSTIGIVKYAF